MAKNSVDAYGASGKTNLLMFDPDTLVLVTDEASPLYDPRVHLPVDEDLARNIDYQGVLEPVLIQKNPETGDVEVVVGRQRVKAARLANEWRHARGVATIQVPAFVHKGNRRDALDAIVSENEVRKADSPLGRAEKMRRLMKLGRGEDEVAVIFGCTVQTVQSTLALLDAPAVVRDAVESGAIGLTHAKALAKLEPAMQREKVTQLIQAASQSTGHDRARKQRAVLDADKPRMKTRREIEAELQTPGLSADRLAALKWVLGLDVLPGLSAAKAAMACLDAQIRSAA